jgi:hypothetical protein
MKTVQLEQLGFESLARLVNTEFRVRVDATESLRLELHEATPPRRARAGGSAEAVYESFSLLFHGPGDRLLPQAIYSIESAALGRFDLFIVPVGRDEKGVRYEAAFNRLVNPDSALSPPPRNPGPSGL